MAVESLHEVQEHDVRLFHFHLFDHPVQIVYVVVQVELFENVAVYLGFSAQEFREALLVVRFGHVTEKQACIDFHGKVRDLLSFPDEILRVLVRELRLTGIGIPGYDVHFPLDCPLRVLVDRRERSSFPETSFVFPERFLHHRELVERGIDVFRLPAALVLDDVHDSFAVSGNDQEFVYVFYVVRREIKHREFDV